MTFSRVFALLLCSALAACSSVRPLEGMDELESARTYLEWGRHDEALDLAERVLVDRNLELDIEADANFIAAEAALALGRHLKAYRLYREVLENAPWSPHVVDIEDRLYEIGVAFLALEEYGGWFDSRSRGVEALESLQAHYRQGDWADESLRLVGDYFGREDVREWLEAALTHEQLYRQYPESKWAERSLWLAGHYRLKLVFGPEYNRDEMLRAKKLLELSLEQHPYGAKAVEARADLNRVTELLARGEVLVANFYAARGNPDGERVRLANAALLFGGTEAGRDALGRLQAMGFDLKQLQNEARLSSTDTFVVLPDPES